MENYFKIRSFSPFTYSYVFLDCDDYLADQLFAKHEVPVRFGVELKKTNTKYRAIFCKVRKRYEEAFKKALDEMENKMLLRGYTDYPEFCEDFKEALDTLAKKDTVKQPDIAASESV